MLKKCMSNLLICLTITFNQSFADTTTAAKAVTPTNAPDLMQIIQKHDQILSQSKQAGEVLFQKSVINNVKADIMKATAGSTEAQLKEAIKTILAQIPSEAKRQEILNKMKYSSKSELQALASSPELLTEAFQGQTSNFIFETATDWLIAGAVVVAIYAIIRAIANASSYDEFYSYPISYSLYYSSPDCSAYDLTSSERSELRADAMRECQARADKPSSCRHDGYETTETYTRDYYGDILEGTCSVQAVAEGKRN